MARGYKDNTALETLRKASKEVKDDTLYIRVLAYRAALREIRNVFNDLTRCAEIAQATIRLDLGPGTATVKPVATKGK
jgi:hypothetical protein